MNMALPSIPPARFDSGSTRPGLDQSKLTGTDWDLPGVHITAQSDAKDSTVEAGNDYIDVVYNGMNHMRLSIQGAQ